MKVDAINKDSVTLDTFNCDLNLVIDPSRYSAHPLTSEEFAYMWAGVRATHGASSGKFCFEVKLLNNIDVSHLPANDPNAHVARVGFSVNTSSLQLGEAALSYCVDGTGKFVTKSVFKNLGHTFQAGDVILAAVNMDSNLVKIGFAKNGTYLKAYRFPKRLLRGRPLFPHVLTKNVSFEVNFGQKETSYFPLPDKLKDYTFISRVSALRRRSVTKPLPEKQNCETSISTLSGEMNTQVKGGDEGNKPHHSRRAPLPMMDPPEHDYLQQRHFGFPPTFPPTFLSDTSKELWGLPLQSSTQQVQPQHQCVDDKE